MTTTLTAPRYALDRALEFERLQLQARTFLDRMSESFLREAGVGPGMRVLDLGCGMGDQVLLASRLVGPTGHVTGLEHDAGTLAAARARIAATGIPNVDLVEGDATALDLVPGAPFDAVIGRLVLHYVPDPAAVLHGAAAVVRPGGLVFASEYDFLAMTSHPHVPSWDRCAVLMTELFTRLGTRPRLGFELPRAFVDAGLPDPVLRGQLELGSSADSPAFAIAAETMRSMAPAFEASGTLTADELEQELGGIEDRLRRDALATGGTVTSPLLVAAWARV